MSTVAFGFPSNSLVTVVPGNIRVFRAYGIAEVSRAFRTSHRARHAFAVPLDISRGSADAAMAGKMTYGLSERGN